MEINNLSQGELIDKIINQANSMNKKIKAFRGKDISEFEEMLHNLLPEDKAKYNSKSGAVSKSTVHYKKMSDLDLKRILSTLHKLNNHDIYGTVNKYQKVATQSWHTLKATVEEHLRKKGYDDKFIFDITNDKGFYDKLYLAFKDLGKGHESKQSIEKVALEYKENGLSEDEIERATNNIENSKNKMDEIIYKARLFDEFEKEVNARGKNRR